MRHALTSELNVVASPALLARGCVNVIGLDRIKAEAGPRWDKLGSSVSAHLESLLRQKLSASDFFVQLNDTSFLVCMPSAAADASQIFCLRIAHELHSAMLGRCHLGQLHLTKAIRVEDGDVQTAEIEGQELVQLAIKAGLDGVPESALLATRRAVIRPAAAKPPEHSHRYVPLWDAQREAITTYRCVTDPSTAPNANLSAADVVKTDLGAALSRIRHAAHSLTEHMKVGERFLISVPLSYETLSSPAGRMEIAAACRGLSSALRPYLIFEIGDLPYGVPQSRLSELVCVVRPFCRAVSGLLPARISSYGAYQSAGLQAIGLSLTANGAVATEMESEVFKLCMAAKRLNILSFVLDAATRDVVRAARDHGANLISGAVIGAPVASPSAVRRLLARDVLGGGVPQSARTQSGWSAVK